MNNDQNLMTSGNIYKEIILFSIPLLLGNLFQQLYNAVDAFIVGNYIGDTALAAVNSSNPLINLLVSFFMGLSVGAGVVISQYFGARNHQGLEKSVHTTMALAIVGGIFLTIIGVVLSPFILKLMDTDPHVMSSSIIYLRIYFFGALGVIIYNMGSGILRAVGDSKRPLYFLIIASIINIILDLLFVVVFKMGVAGVGLATLIAQAISAILTIWLLVKTTKPYKLKLKKIRFDKFTLLKIVKIGLPSAIQNAIVSFSNVVVQTNINSFGELAMAGAGSYVKIDGFAILPVLSFSMAATTFTGQNYGAGKLDRVKAGVKATLIISIVTIIAISIPLYIFGPQILSLFSSNQEVIKYGVIMMHCVVPGYILLAISHTLSGVLRGVGLTKIPMYVMVGCWCLARMVWISTTVSIFHDIKYVFYGWPITWIMSTIIFIIYYKRSNWINN